MPADNDAIRGSHLACEAAKFIALIPASVRAPSRLRRACLAMLVTNWTKGREHATMGSMSASDAAPLPRLGEVFFDVRGSSRSMRLSWYADTGVSVFSVWQGGTCTGTFRLPQEELPRLIDALQRGMYPDPRGPGGFSSQLPGAPTDPRLRALPGYAGMRDFTRDADYTGPTTGDFRAFRADDPAGMVGLGSAAPRALPPGGGYRDQLQYPEQAQYAEPSQYADQARYPEQAQPSGYRGQEYPQRDQYLPPGQYPDQVQYADLDRYAPQGQYAGPGYAERGTYAHPGSQPGQGYDSSGYATADEQGHQGYGYAEQGYPTPAYPEPAYSGSSYPDPSYPGQGHNGQSYPDQGYDDRGYQQAYQGQARSEQDYRQSASAYPDQGYAGYGYAEQDHRGRGYADHAETGQAHLEQGYTGYAYDQGNSGYPAGSDSGRYDGPGYERASRDGGYDHAGYDSAGSGRAGYDSPGYDSVAYGGASYDDGSGRSGGYGQLPAASGPRERSHYEDPDVTPSEPISSFPYDGGPPPGGEHRRRRRR